MQTIRADINRTKDSSMLAKQKILKTAMLKREASKLRFEELEVFKKERDESIQAEKYKIIEKHLNLKKIAECKSDLIIKVCREATITRNRNVKFVGNKQRTATKASRIETATYAFRRRTGKITTNQA